MKIFDNNWVGHSVMKPVDAKSFQRRKDIKKVGGGGWRLWHGDSRGGCSREGIKRQK